MNPFANNYATTSRRKRVVVNGRTQYGQTIYKKPRLPRAGKPGMLKVGKTLKPELKFFDLSQSHTLTTSLSNMIDAPGAINSVPQGDSQNERIGNRIIVKSVMVHGYLKCAGVSSSTISAHRNIARIMLLIDHQASGIVPSAGDILSNVTSINSFYDLNQSQRFTILKNLTIPVVLEVVVGAVEDVQSIEKLIPFDIFQNLNMLVQFDGVTDDIASINNNSIFMFGYIEDSNSPVTVFFNTRLRYTG